MCLQLCNCEKHCEERPEYESDGSHCVTEQQVHSRFSNILTSVYYGVKSMALCRFNILLGWKRCAYLQKPHPQCTLEPCSSPLIVVEAVCQRLLVVSYAVEPKWDANELQGSTKLHIQYCC